MVKTLRGLCAAAGVLAVTAGAALAQDEPPPPPATAGASDTPAPVPGDPDFYGALLGDQFSGPIEGDERVIYAVGGLGQPVWIRQPGFELRCDSVVLWGDKDTLVSSLRERDPAAKEDPRTILGPVIHALYAEGQVTMRRDRQTLRGERMFLDFQKGEAYLVNAELHGIAGEQDGRRIPLAVRADIVRGLGVDRFRAEGASFTTCAYEDPHYHFSTGVLDVDFSEDFVSFETGWWPGLRADTVLGDDTPILVLPKLGGRTFETRPLMDVNVGSSDRFGTNVELLWGGDLKDDDSRKWGEWRLHTDYRRKRGAGVGVDVDLFGDGEKGRRDELDVQTYYQRDTNREDGFSDRPFDGAVGGSTSPDRGRLRAWFRQHGGASDLLPEGWRIDGELSLYSDRGFLPEYEREETLTGKQQETFVEVRRLWGNQGLSFLASTRAEDEAVALVRQPSDLFLTDYATQTDYLPSIAYHLIDQPLLSRETTGFAPLGLSLQASVANVQRNWDDTTEDLLHAVNGWSGERIARGDLESRLSMPFSLGPVTVSPAVGASYMAVDTENGYASGSSVSDDDATGHRHAEFWGVRAGIEAHREYDADSDLLSLHGLRHVASLDGQYFDRFDVSEESGTFQENDLIDELGETRMASVRLRNRLQTKREGEVVDWLDYEVRFLTLLEDHGGRPTLLGYREDAPQPLQRLDFAGEDKYAGRDSGSLYHQHRARMQLLPSVWLVGEGDYDMDREYWETTLGGMRWNVDDQLSLYAGRRSIHDDSTIWTLRADYRLTNRWVVSVYQQENTENDKRFDTKVSLYRRAHDFTLALEVESDAQLDETSFAVAIYPNDWLGGDGDPLAKKRDLDYDAMRWYR